MNTVAAFTVQENFIVFGFLLNVAEFLLMLYSPTEWEMKQRNWGCCVLKMSKAGRAGWLPFDSSRYQISCMNRATPVVKLQLSFCLSENTYMFLSIICLQNNRDKSKTPDRSVPPELSSTALRWIPCTCELSILSGFESNLWYVNELTKLLNKVFASIIKKTLW